MSKNNAGFTLIELLVAVSIFMAVIISVYSAFSAGIFSWQRLNASRDIYQQTEISLQLMADEIASYTPNSKIRMQGTGSEISFLSGLSLIKFYFDPSAKTIMKSSEGLKPDKNSIISEEFLPSVKDMKLTYFCKDTTGAGGYVWVNSLDGMSNKDCEAVKISVSVSAKENARGREAQAVNFSKIALILQKEN